jgi:hypothetical protein
MRRTSCLLPIAQSIIFVALAPLLVFAQTVENRSAHNRTVSMPSTRPRALVHQLKEDAVARLAISRADDLLVGIIEMDVSLTAMEFADVQVPGQLVQVWLQSRNSSWSGTVRTSSEEPIQNLQQALKRFEQNYAARFDDVDSRQFGVKAFAIRGTAAEIQYALSLFRTAELVHLSDTGPRETSRQQQLGNNGLREIYIPGAKARALSSQKTTISPASIIPTRPPYPFLPTRSTLKIGPDSNANQRRVEGSIYWATNDSLQAFHTGDIENTLELQVVLADNADSIFVDDTYLGTMTSFGADWQYSYYDTAFLDSLGIEGTPTEVQFVVGSAYPRLEFVANRTYNFWITTTKGTIDTNWAKFQGQLGYQTNSCLLLSWADCIFGYNSGTENISNGFSIVVPSVPRFDSANPPTFYVGQPETSSTLDKFNSRGLTPVIPFQDAFNRVSNAASTIGNAVNAVHHWSTGLIQDFDGGASGKNAIMLAGSSSTAFWIHGAIWQFYIPDGPDRVLFDGTTLGYPTTNEQPASTSPFGTTGQVQDFANGQIYWHRTGPRANSTYLVPAAIFRKYITTGATSGQLGFPVTNAYQWSAGIRSDFEGGYIYWTASAGAVAFYNTVSTPAKPTGPASGTKGTSYTYSTSGATASDGSAIQYRFSWGDGTYSAWLPTGVSSASHSWVAGGSYYVQAQAQTTKSPPSSSALSPALSVSIADNTAIPTSLNVTANLPTSAVAPYSAITINGSVTYNTGVAVTAGTVSISTGEGLFTASVTNGIYSRVITAPSTSRNIQISSRDNLYGLTGSAAPYLAVLSNQTADGYRLNRTTTSRDVQSVSPYDPIFETEFFRRTDTKAVVWANFTDLYRAIRVRFDYYGPTGSLEFSSTSNWTDDPAAHGYLYYYWWKLWSWVWINNSGAAYRPGRWSCRVFVDNGTGWKLLQTESFTIGYEFAEHRMAEGVQTSAPWDPIGPTNVFRNTDSQALTWARLANVTEGLGVKWDYYEPNGSRYFSFTYDSPDPGTDRYYPDFRTWGYINIAGNAAAQKCGDWRVVVSIKDVAGNYQPTYTDYFQILEATADPPTAATSISPAAPAAGQLFTLRVSANDTTYLKRVTLYWKDSTVHSRTWDNIFASSLNQSVSIGPYNEGQQVEMWAEAWDTSGNRRETTHSTVVIRPALGITGPASLSLGVVGLAYPATNMAAAGGTTPYTWSATGLPTGLGINTSTGVISGTPTSNTGSPFNVVVKVTDGTSATANQSYSLTINPPLAITGTTSLPVGVVGAPYSPTTIPATGGIGPYTWSATGLPVGLSINTSSGVISGTPTSSTGSPFSINITVTDSTSRTASKAYLLMVNPALTITGPASLLVGVMGSAYPLTTMAATGGTGPYTWSAIGLPAGLTISASTGLISGTPSTATGSPFSVNITATDTGARTATKSYLLTINPALAITGPVSLPAGMVSVAYPSTAITATGGTSPYTWSATGLPIGLSINTSTGVISGTPTGATGSPFSVNITVTDSASRILNKAYLVSIFPTLMITAPAALPSWTVGVLYPPTTIRATGGTGQYTWSATGLPAGLSINVSTGVIFGTPTLVTGSPFNVNITVIDSAWFSSKAYSLTINPAPAITGPASLPVGVVGLAYPITNMTAAGGTLPYAWSATGLPTGLSIDAITGVISGTPTTNQGSPFGVVVKVTDGASVTAIQSYALTINAPLAITGPASLLSGVVRVAYPPTTIVAIGGIGPYIWSAIGLPPGLTINSSTGVISGTPTTTKGSPFSVNITVTDSTSRKVSQAYSVIVDRK